MFQRQIFTIFMVVSIVCTRQRTKNGSFESDIYRNRVLFEISPLNGRPFQFTVIMYYFNKIDRKTSVEISLEGPKKIDTTTVSERNVVEKNSVFDKNTRLNNTRLNL